MEKLSSILPKSPRTQNVDNSKAQPARPGAPLLGRPMGRVTNKTMFEGQDDEVIDRAAPNISFADKFSMTTPEDRVSVGNEETGPNAKLASYTRKGELQKVKIAEDVSRKFANLSLPEVNSDEDGLALSEASIAQV